MRMTINTFANDLAEYSNADVRHRRAISKIVIEEYLPLFLLAQTLPDFMTACLTPNSHLGPDAMIYFNCRPLGSTRRDKMIPITHPYPTVAHNL